MTSIRAILRIYFLLTCCCVLPLVAQTVEKSGKERGLYLHPEIFGAPAEKSIVTARHPGAGEVAKAVKARLKDSAKR